MIYSCILSWLSIIVSLHSKNLCKVMESVIIHIRQLMLNTIVAFKPALVTAVFCHHFFLCICAIALLPFSFVVEMFSSPYDQFLSPHSFSLILNSYLFEAHLDHI